MINSLQKTLVLAITVPVLLAACATTENTPPAKVSAAPAASPAPAAASLYSNAAPLDLRLSTWPYPYPIKEFKTSLQGQPASMVYMDVPAVGK